MKFPTAISRFFLVFMCRALMLGCVLVSSGVAQVVQDWVERYNGPGNFSDAVADMAVDSAGNVYVTGSSHGGSSTSTDYATIKYSSAGVQQWVVRYAGQGAVQDLPKSIAVDDAGNVYVTGQSVGSDGNWEYATVKYNSSGTQQWVVRYDSPIGLADVATSVAVDSAGNVYVTGSSYVDATATDLATIKYNSSGVQQWVARFSAAAGGAGSIAVDNAGNIYVAGQTWAGTEAELDYTTIKYSPSGDQQWVATYNGPGDGSDYILSLAVDTPGNVYVTGYGDGGVANDFATIKYNSLGAQQWVAAYNGPGDLGDHARSLALDPSGNVYVTGESYGGSTTRNDYATIKYNSSGIQQWVSRYNGPGNLDDRAYSLALDNAGNVYVTGGSIAAGVNSDYATVKYNTDGVQQWVIRYEGPAAGNDVGASIAVDNGGSVSVAGYSIGTGTSEDFATVQYGPEPILFLYPSVSSTLVAGEMDTIFWSGGPDRVTIQLSTNYEGGQGTFEELAVNISASDHYYAWNIPGTTLSRKCAISIENAANPDEYTISDVFKIKPYRLTRVDANGDYEFYEIGQDAWNFSNYEDNMWPEPYYRQFDYRDGMDPFTMAPYDPIFELWWVHARSYQFPDWPSVVRSFGTDQCYVTLSHGGIPKLNAFLYWTLIKLPSWGGSCAGFAGTSFLAFDRKDDFIDRFGMAQFGNLRNAILDDVSRRVVNEAWTYQMGSSQKARILSSLLGTPNSALGQVKAMFLNENSDNQQIGVSGLHGGFPPVAGHAINPWKVEKDAINPDIEHIFVYDNNGHNILDLTISVNTAENEYTYPPLNFYNKINGIDLLFSTSSYLENANMPLTPGETSQRGGQLEVFNTLTASITMINPAGDSLVLDYQDSSYMNNIPDAVPNILLTGYPTAPIGYYLPDDTYSVAMADFADSSMHFAIWSDSTVLMFGRNDADTTQTDLLSIDNGIGTGNPDIVAKEGNYLALVVGASDQKMIDLNGFTMVQADSVHFSTVNGNHGRFMNAGPAKTYNLSLRRGTDTDLTRFEHPDVVLDANSTHQITPDWLDLAEVTILVDLGNNGTIDDTMTLGNTVAVEEQTQSSIPTSFSLSQNYPNPFNPATTIAYGLPSRSQITLKIYNLLGEELSTLVDEVQDAGHRTVSWNASAFPSGVYFYRIQVKSLTTGEIFIQSGKMSLVK